MPVKEFSKQPYPSYINRSDLLTEIKFFPRRSVYAPFIMGLTHQLKVTNMKTRQLK